MRDCWPQLARTARQVAADIAFDAHCLLALYVSMLAANCVVVDQHATAEDQAPRCALVGGQPTLEQCVDEFHFVKLRKTVECSAIPIPIPSIAPTNTSAGVWPSSSR